MRYRPISKLVPAAALLLAGALTLSACGSNNNGTTNGNSGLGTQSAASDGNQPVNVTKADCVSGTLTADGSTAQQNAMALWIKDYQTKCPGATITYGGGGSGQGVTDFTNGQVNFAGSDAALDPSKGEVAAATKGCGSQAIDLPMVTGPIAVSYHVSGVSDLTLTADEVAKIFTGKITKWNDPAIVATNPGAKLPSSSIHVFNRSDASGTTYNFESYLKASAPSVWSVTPDKQWAGAGQGKDGNPLLGQAVQSTSDSIGYVEWSYALQNGLSIAKIDNGGGAVALSSDTVGKTVDTAKPNPSGPGDLTLKLDYATKTPGAYPIVLVTYELVCTKYKDPQVGAMVKSFMNFISSTAEQDAVHGQGYAALPADVQQKVQAEIEKIS
jgi:phosphate transport system substrate-binding protein